MPSNEDDRVDCLSVLMAADFVKSARISARKSQRQLADAIRTSKDQIWRLEQGTMKRGPTVALLARIARACGGTLKISME